MPKYIVFFTYDREAVNALVEKPSDRETAVRDAVRAVGANLEAFYWMTGPHDGFVIVDAPATANVAAISIGAGSTGAFAHLETYELIPPGAIVGLLRQAKEARSAFRAPGR